jgi:DNA-binding IclR family transcriptional regulator
MVKTMAGRDSKNRRGIQSVEIGLRVIEALCRAGGPQTLKDLARTAELPASNCHRYLVSFVRAGFVVQEVRSGRYEPGPRLLQAGMAALARIDSMAVATEALERVVDATGNTGLIAVWGEAGPTIVRWMPGRIPVHTSLSTGSILPLLTSATGRVFLAFLPARQTSVLLAREVMSNGGDPNALIAAVRAAGIGQVCGDHIPGLSAVAAPVLNAHGEAATVITLVAAARAIPAVAIDRLRLETADASARLGWTPRNADIA